MLLSRRVALGIASINAMVVAVACYLLGDLLLGRRAPEGQDR